LHRQTGDEERMTTTEAAIAANRFGFGARPGDLARLGSSARAALLAQVDGGPPLLSDPALPSSRALLARAAELREAPRPAQGKRDDAANGAGAGSAGNANATGATAATPPADQAVKIAKLVRETFQPAYVADVAARTRLAITTDRDFLERLVHFWSNHFAVSVDKAAVLGLPGTMEREAIRPHVLGNFADMLVAVEQHPAMLLYLDNQQSLGPNSQAAKLASRRGRDIGLNENLGREILELHTLGVDAGYSQQDVRALATIITGWSLGGGIGNGPLRSGGEPGAFFFRPALHEPGSQQLLGRRYAQDGVAQGIAALRDLAVDPHTARHVATKLARHFVADDPPTALIDRLAKAWVDSRGNLPTVYRALVNAPEAWRTPLAKYKTPADYVHSTFRALALPLRGVQQEARVFDMLGQRSFQPGSPAGWPDRSVDWDGPSALLKRLEWAQELGQKFGNSRDALAIADASLGPVLTDDTRNSIRRAQDGAQALTLLLASPEFMRR
jgi:uncharacterized protein (DUF1800 family)